MSKQSDRNTERRADSVTERQNDSMADSRAAKEPALVAIGFNLFSHKGCVKKIVHPKFDPTLEGDRFVLGGCPSHHLLYS